MFIPPVIQSVRIEDFVKLALSCPVFDVRSPGEYNHAHIPGAISLPLFTDEERKIVGTEYKLLGRKKAIRSGLDFFGGKMSKMVEEVEGIIASFRSEGAARESDTVLVHCWRGGMRSAGVAWLLDLYGFKVYTLKGGYKAYRNWVLATFTRRYPFRIIGGYTGSGKTEILHKMAAQGYAVIDLEGLACHRGSTFGALGQKKQPGQEQFENLLAYELYRISVSMPECTPIWMEDESRRIGDVNLPPTLLQTMKTAPLFFLEIPFEERLTYITNEYGKFKPEDLIHSVLRIQKRLGSLNTKKAINFLLEKGIREGFRITLNYYDKFYSLDLEKRKAENPLVTHVHTDRVDATENIAQLLKLI